MTPSCPTCCDFGTYLDSQCRDKTCAHRLGRFVEHREIRVQTPHGERWETKTVRYGNRVMRCPVRTCLCPAGRARRTA